MSFNVAKLLKIAKFLFQVYKLGHENEFWSAGQGPSKFGLISQLRGPGFNPDLPPAENLIRFSNFVRINTSPSS